MRCEGSDVISSEFLISLISRHAKCRGDCSEYHMQSLTLIAGGNGRATSAAMSLIVRLRTRLRRASGPR